MRRNGETNPVTIIVLVLIAAAGFYAFHVVPVYMDNLDVRTYVGEAFSQYWLQGEASARANLIITMNDKQKAVSHVGLNKRGEREVMMGYGIEPEDVKFTLDERTKVVTVRLEYDRVVTFAPLKKYKVFHFVVEKSGKTFR